MALGGGLWTTQNKVLPGAYINFVSRAKASVALSERGIAAVPLVLDWGPAGQIFIVQNEDFQKHSQKIFGYAYDSPQMLCLRELFKYTKTLVAYRLCSSAVKASCTYATAKYYGTRGNALKIVIANNVDNSGYFDVSTYLGTVLVDIQTVSAAANLVDNDYVVWVKTATLATTAGAALTSGTNGTTTDGTNYQAFLDAAESYSFNVLGCPTDNDTIKALFGAYTARMRDEIGAKFQLVAYRYAGDYEGVISVQNACVNYNESTQGIGAFGAVYWMIGAAASCKVNESNTNKKYNGELSIDVDYTQTELSAGITEGKLMFHNVDGEVRLLEDINTLVTLTDTKGEDFQSNQTIRVNDQAAIDLAIVFNTRFLGKVPNDADGRISLWNSFCRVFQELEKLRALENFIPESMTLAEGDTKKAVVCNLADYDVVNAMSKLYMSIQLV